MGDGANDCGALKQADIGLSLSLSESSISAPFTATDLNPAAILQLLVQARAGLETSLSCFKFMAFYRYLLRKWELILVWYSPVPLCSCFQVIRCFRALSGFSKILYSFVPYYLQCVWINLFRSNLIQINYIYIKFNISLMFNYL